MNINPEDTDTSVSKDNNITESWIQFTPTPLHHQQIITCRATNYKLQGTNNVMEDHQRKSSKISNKDQNSASHSTLKNLQFF